MKSFYRHYLIIILFLWTCGIYLTWREFYLSSYQKKVLEDRIEDLQNQLKRVRHQLSLKIPSSRQFTHGGRFFR